MSTVDLDDLGPAATLALAGSTVRMRRQLEVTDLEVAGHWADLHASDPKKAPGGGPSWVGDDQLVEIGGDGTPLVRELCVPELGIARECHTYAAHALVADALDLRHRLPLTWAITQTLVCEVWVARKVAALTRGLDHTKVALVDRAVAAVIGTEAPGRVLTITAAKIIEADPAAHAAKLEAERRRKSVTLSEADEHGLRFVIARVEAGDAFWVYAMIDRVADILATRRDLTPGLPTDASRDELRAVAFGWLARPEDLLALLMNPTGQTEPGESTEPAGTSKLRPTATLYVHLNQAAVDGTATGVARVEGLGPFLLDQVRELLGHTRVIVKPVIDLHDQTSVNAYEHPETIKERVHLRTAGDTFPHAAGLSRHLDLDHPDPYQPDGPPGQTGDHNAALLNRRGHRAKTHLSYRHRQLDLTTYVWSTPHGLHRLVDSHGTHVIDDALAAALSSDSVLERELALFLHRDAIATARRPPRHERAP